MNEQTLAKRFGIAVVWIIGLFGVTAFYLGVAYVAVHFIHKFWNR